jgi:hypothetical protein
MNFFFSHLALWVIPTYPWVCYRSESPAVSAFFFLYLNLDFLSPLSFLPALFLSQYPNHLCIHPIFIKRNVKKKSYQKTKGCNFLEKKKKKGQNVNIQIQITKKE